MNKVKEVISLKGDKDLWRKFTIKAKIRREKIWDILKLFIIEYISFDPDKIQKCTDAAIKEYQNK